MTTPKTGRVTAPKLAEVPTAQDGPTDPETIEECQAELAAIQEWFDELNQRTQQAPQVQARAAYLSGLAKGKGWE